MAKEAQILEQGFQPKTQGLSGWIPGEIQILRQVFRTETQILIIISSPGICLSALGPAFMLAHSDNHDIEGNPWIQYIVTYYLQGAARVIQWCGDTKLLPLQITTEGGSQQYHDSMLMIPVGPLKPWPTLSFLLLSSIHPSAVLSKIAGGGSIGTVTRGLWSGYWGQMYRGHQELPARS